MKSLPIGISNLKMIREHDMVYVDKTGIIYPWVSKPGRYFLARPRRFGKSLLVDTFKELFEGNEELFRELSIHDRWDWSKKYPVVKIDLAGGTLSSRQELDGKLLPLFDRYAGEHGITLTTGGVANRFNELIRSLSETAGMPVVVLVDEYDKPILDHIDDLPKAEEMRDLLKDFYSCIKEVDEYLQFVFLTGVSKFGKVSIFSGINNLNDLSLDSAAATLCGYTQRDLETVFAEHLSEVDKNELRRWYNGYSFMGEPVYNPFDILLFLQKGRVYRNYWFETGTPSFLIKLLQRERFFLPELENLEISEDQFSSFELERIPPVVFLFQTGYLTVERTFRRLEDTFFTLKIPNMEVRRALSNSFFSGYTDLREDRARHQLAAYDALLAADMPGLGQAIRRLFSSIPWRNFTNNDIADFEGYYASVLYAFFTSATCTVIPEDTSNHGQADLTVMLETTICVMEIKVVDGADVDWDAKPNLALEQLRTRNYAQKYLGDPGKRVVEVGMLFSRGERNLVQFGHREC
jgi:hypothetical protein